MSGKVREFDHDWRVATLKFGSLMFSSTSYCHIITEYDVAILFVFYSCCINILYVSTDVLVGRNKVKVMSQTLSICPVL